MRMTSALRLLAVLTGAALIPACGGGGSAAAATSTTVSGKAVNGPLQAAVVQVYALTATGALGTLLGSGVTDVAGNYSITITPQAGAIGVKVSGGGGAQYKDEASGATIAFGVADVLLAYVPSGAGPAFTANVTALTHWAALRVQLVTSGSVFPLSTLVTRVNSFVAAQFGLTNLTGVAPNDLTAGAQTAGTEATHYGLVLAGLSQEAGTAAVAVMPLINAIGTDFQTDGSFNGLNVGAPVVLGGGNLSTTASTSGLATGMTAFLGGGQNASTIAAAAESAFITPISAASAPAVPAGLAGTPGSMTVTLTWNGVPGAATYNVYMAGVTGVTPANYGSLAGGMAHTTVASPFFHAGLAPGPYYFIVTAVNGAGEGLPSGELYLIVP